MTVLPTVALVTGTDTEVGKTTATAALAAVLTGAGRRVAVDKPTQTGVLPGEPGDAHEVARLSGAVTVSEGVRLIAPMAPRDAAAFEQRSLPGLGAHVARITHLAAHHDHVLVEGSGGLLVRMTQDGETLAELATALPLTDLAVVVVCRSALGTQNHTELTLEALAARAVPVSGLIINHWPGSPTEIVRSNRRHLEGLGVPILGELPADAPLHADSFRQQAPSWIRLTGRP